VAQSKGKGGNFASQANPFFGGPQRKGTAPDLTEVPELSKAVQVLLKAGCAILIGQTRDGGAVVLTILDGEQRHRTYCASDVDVREALTAIHNMYDD
jgi:hypothetical protein